MIKQDEIEPRRRAFIHLLKAHGIDADELAKRANIPASTIHKYVIGETDTLNTAVESAVAKALGVSKTELFIGQEPAIVEPIYVPVLGLVQAGAWMESSDYESVETIPMAPDPRFTGLKQFAFKVHGPSMNQIVRSGDYVLCVDWQPNNFTPIDGQIVIARRERDNLLETTLKQIEIGDDSTIILRPRSDDTRFQQPIRLKGKHEEGSEGIKTKISALVVGRYQSLI